MFCQLQHVDVVIDDWLDWLDRNAQRARCGLRAEICPGLLWDLFCDVVDFCFWSPLSLVFFIRPQSNKLGLVLVTHYYQKAGFSLYFDSV